MEMVHQKLQDMETLLSDYKAQVIDDVRKHSSIYQINRILVFNKISDPNSIIFCLKPTMINLTPK